MRYYLSSGQNEVAEYDGAGQRLRYYVHGPTYIDERVVMHNDPVAGGAATTGSDYIYLLKDLYTVAGMADERGWPVERYDYDAYGKVYMERVRVLPWAADFDGDGDVDDDDLAVVHAAYRGSGQEPNGPRGWRADLDGDGDVDGSDYALFADAYRGSGVAPGGNLSLRSASMVVSRIGNPYFFTGRRLDVIDIQNAGTPHHFTDDYAGLQIYDYRARTYDPVVGRFSQRDPSGYVDGMGMYQYVRGAPGRGVDPLGACVPGEQRHTVSTALTPGESPDDTKYVITVLILAEIYDAGPKNPSPPFPISCLFPGTNPNPGVAMDVWCHFYRILQTTRRLQVWTKVKCRTCVERRKWWCLWLKKYTFWEEQDRGWQPCDVLLSEVPHAYPGNTAGLSKDYATKLVDECEKKASEGASCGTKE